MAAKRSPVIFSHNLAVIGTNLEPLAEKDYVIAFGPAGQYLFGTQHGYAAGHLPEAIVLAVKSGVIKKIVWASFGSQSDSWIITWKNARGSFETWYGPNISASLRQFLVRNASSPTRVQFGAHDSYVAWTRSAWICRNVPGNLEAYLKDMSSSYQYGPIMGNFKIGYLTNVTWHSGGSFFAMGYFSSDAEHAGRKFCVSHIRVGAIQAAWKQLWNMEDGGHPPITELIHASIDSYSAQCDRYVFIKAQKQGNEADFIFALDPPKIESRLTLPDNRIMKDPRPPQKTQWAYCTRNGRPTSGDTWELKLTVGEHVEILKDLGNDWFIAKNTRGVQGYAHRTMLDFRTLPRLEPPQAYVKYQQDIHELFSQGNIRVFPDLSKYVDTCRLKDCKAEKQDPAGLRTCVHDLDSLLRGSGCYSREFLKEERNRWHPDKFGRFCEQSLKGELQAKAEHLFVLMGVLMDWFQQSD